jgi:hypothetical protein
VVTAPIWLPILILVKLVKWLDRRIAARRASKQRTLAERTTPRPTVASRAYSAQRAARNAAYPGPCDWTPPVRTVRVTSTYSDPDAVARRARMDAFCAERGL